VDASFYLVPKTIAQPGYSKHENEYTLLWTT
jgi:hypothetical protein